MGKVRKIKVWRVGNLVLIQSVKGLVKIGVKSLTLNEH